MKNLDKVNELKRDEIVRILSNEDVVKYFSSIKLFGSAVTTRCKESSDLDLFVTLKPEYVNKKGINASYVALILASDSDKDIFYAHEQHGKNNPKLYDAMCNGIELLGD